MKVKHSRKVLYRAVITALGLSTIAHAVRAQKSDIAVTADFNNVTLREAIETLHQKTSYNFLYVKAIVDAARNVNKKFNNIPFRQVLKEIFQDQPLNYIVRSNNVILSLKKEQPAFLLSGNVKDEQGNPLFGVNIENTSNHRFYHTEADGSFAAASDSKVVQLKFSYAGHGDTIWEVSTQAPVLVIMKAIDHGTNEVVKTAYGATSRRLITGSVTKITTAKITTTPYAKMQDVVRTVPGLFTTSSSGVSWSGISMELRGPTNILPLSSSKNLNAPLIVINSMSMPQGNIPLNLIGSLTGDPGNEGAGNNPLAFLNPDDIESIEVLKDADATAIYGARGAYGAILITTKRSKVKQLQVQAGFHKSFFGKAYRLPKVLTTAQYADLVNEAYRNNNAPADGSELERWGTNHYTNFPKLLFGGNAGKEAVSLSLSGGANHFSWLVSGRRQQESYSLPVEATDHRATIYTAMDYQAVKGKLKIALTAYYGDGKTMSIAANPMQGIYMAPNLPFLRDSSGKLLSNINGIDFDNPLGPLENTYRANDHSLTGNITITYSLFGHVQWKTSLGGTWQQLEETALSTLAAKAQSGGTGNFTVASHIRSNKIIEQQIDYNGYIGPVKISALLGGSWQEEQARTRKQTFNGYHDDALLKADAARRKPDTIAKKVQYKYAGSFVQLTGNLQDRYILNVSVRQDASSRFARGNRSALFMSAGAAWIFSDERFLQKQTSWLSFGKLRASYGNTGSDRIGDYKYFDAWVSLPVDYPYDGTEAITQQRPNIPNYRWETTEKAEMGLDLEVVKLIDISAAFFRHRTFNQLLAFPLPSQTGFSAMEQANFPATVQNTGMEFTVQKLTKKKGKTLVSLIATYAFYRNKLLDSPVIGNNTASRLLVVGQPLSARMYYGASVDPASGLGKVTREDTVIRNRDITGQASFSATISHGPWSLGLMAEARWQPVLSAIYFTSLGAYPGSVAPGMYSNQLTAVQDRWRKPGDQAPYPRSSRNPSQDELDGMKALRNSGAAIDKGFYCMLRTVSLQYSAKKDWLKKFGLNEMTIYLQGENLFLLSGNIGNPSLLDQQALPAIRTLSVGIQIKP